jgi:hypothetical protein
MQLPEAYFISTPEPPSEKQNIVTSLVCAAAPLETEARAAVDLSKLIECAADARRVTR